MSEPDDLDPPNEALSKSVEGNSGEASFRESGTSGHPPESAMEPFPDAANRDPGGDDAPEKSEPERVSESTTAVESPAHILWPDPGFFTLDSRYVPCERLGGIIVTISLAVAAVIGFVIHLVAGEWVFISTIVLAGVSALLLAIAVASWKWPALEFRNTRWRINPTGIEIQKGVLWRHRIIVPLSRVQHADVTQGPLQRWYGIGTLVVHTAGTRDASVELGGIDHAGAIQLRDTIVRFRSQQNEP